MGGVRAEARRERPEERRYSVSAAVGTVETRPTSKGEVSSVKEEGGVRRAEVSASRPARIGDKEEPSREGRRTE